MTQVAIAILHLPDSRVVFQRRDGNAPRGANKLSFFGGHIKPSEDPYQAIVRELGEETSLNVPSLNLKHLNSFRLTLDTNNRKETVHFHAFAAHIEKCDFQVYEGVGFEIYSIAEATRRDDLVPSAKTALGIFNSYREGN